MDLQRALERQQFSVYYQPIVAVQIGEITGCEALVRWNHPTRGLIAPGEFIANMEDTGLIVPIGKWILRTACAQNKAWQQVGFPAIYVSVNVSLVQFHRQNFTRIVSQTLEETGLDHRWLRLELTESVLMEDAELTSRTLNELGKMGIRIAIDDFGTGYSSMSYLHCLPLQSLKIDRSFLHAIKGDDCPAAEIMTTMTRLGNILNLEVTAEGVASEHHLTFLRSLHCTEMQGFLFFRPMPPEDLTNLFHQGWQSNRCNGLFRKHDLAPIPTR